MKWDIERRKQIKNKREGKKNSAGNEKLPLPIKYGGNTRRKIIHELYGNLKIPARTPMIYDTSIIVNHEMCARALDLWRTDWCNSKTSSSSRRGDRSLFQWMRFAAIFAI